MGEADLSHDELRRRLAEAEETLRAIRDGEADAVVMRGSGDDEVHPLGNGHESYRAIMEAMDIGAVALDAGRTVVYANAAFCKLLACRPEALQSRGLLASLDSVSATAVERLMDLPGQPHRSSQFARSRGDEIRHIVVTIAPLPLAFGEGSVLTFTDVTERLAAERASESARIARAVISSANEAVVVCDRRGLVVNANTAAMTLVDNDPLDRPFHEAFPLSFPITSPIIHADDLVDMAIEGNAIQGLEARLGKDGQGCDLLASAAPLRLTAESIGGCVVTLVDNSDRKAAEQRQSLLLRELDHRVKNTLAMVMSIASRTSANATDLADFRSRFNSRLQALAATHTLLAEASWSGLLLSSIVRRELAPFTTSAGPKLVMRGLDRKVSPDVAIAFGLVIHELTTNAVKYGALSENTGIVTIAAESVSEGIIHVSWIESGGPEVVPPTHRGFGQTLIARSLDRGTGGRASVEFKPSGVTCEMAIPVS